MKHITTLLAAGAAIAFATPASAQTTHIGVTAGTLGIGPEVGYRTSNFGVRGNATFFGLDRNVDSDGIEYDGELKLRSYGASVDFYPGGGGFRISPGVRISRNRIGLSATPTEDVEIGDNVYTPAEIGVISGEVRAKKLAPTLTVGWGSGVGSGLYFGLDAGAMFQGAPRVKSLETTGMLNDPALQADIDRERDEIEDDIDNYKIYPILQLALGYRFGAAPAAAPIVEPQVVAPVVTDAPATQTCADGSVILATDMCPAAPIPPAAPAGERG